MSVIIGLHHYDFHSYLSHLTHIVSAGETRDASHCHHTHKQLCKLIPHLSYDPASVTQEMPEELPLTHASQTECAHALVRECIQTCALNETIY